MPDYLLIRAQNAAAAIDVLAVAAEITERMGDDAQVDIATSEEYAEYLRLSEVVRRVVGVNAPDIAGLASPPPPEDAGGGLGGKLFSLGKKVASVAGQNARQYWELAKDLRVVRYDAVFDFDSSAFSIAIARAAKADKIIGFDARNIDKPATGASLLYSETYHISADMSNAMLLRHLPARFFDYKVGGQVDSGIISAPSAEATPYVAVVGEVPPPFADVLQETNQRLVVRREQTGDAKEMAGVVQHAAFVVGNGISAAIAAACGVRTFFIGGKRELPEGAVWCSTPATLADACSSYLASFVKKPPEAELAEPAAPAAPATPVVEATPVEATPESVSVEKTEEPAATEAAAPPPPPQQKDEPQPAENSLLSKLKKEKE